jgi:hypothetical protein
VCFSPEEDCAAFAVGAIDNAEREILVAAYGLTTGSGIVEALVHAKGRGVDVRLIADKTTPCPAASGIAPLAAAGVPIWIDAGARVAHAKTMVIDQAVTLMGPTTGPAAPRQTRKTSTSSHPQLSQQPMRPTGGEASQCPSDTNDVRTGAGSLARQCNCSAVGAVMFETQLGRIWCRIADGLDYWLTLTKLRLLDALAGSDPETPADLQRRHYRERIERAFPKIES